MLSDTFWDTRLAWLRYVFAWIAYAGMRAIVHLPFRWQLAIGKAFGRTTRLLLRARRRVAARNLEVCFPELPPAERDRLVREHFASLGASIVEMSMGWFGSEPKVRAMIRVEGAEHLRAALGRGKGVILSSAHFTTFELFWPALKPLCTRLCGMYKGQRNPVMNKAMNLGRSRSYDVLFANDDVRAMLKQLRENSVVWYAGDQSYTGKGSALLPFFGEPAMTNTALSRIARISGAAVIPYFCRRLPDHSGYVMSIGAPLDGLPSHDEQEDTRRLTRLLEDYVRLCPEQYWWIHKRFKSRPAPLPNLYAAERPAT
jgi:KDO2-lipid IV(A) lauroyltransferase